MDLLGNTVASAWGYRGPRPGSDDVQWLVDPSFFPVCFGWVVLWALVLCVGEGRTAKNSIYRVHFLHGIIGPVLAVLTVLGRVSFEMTMGCTLAYFLVDFLNMILNDIIAPVKGYQKPGNRVIEYVHHVIVLGSAAACLLLGNSACQIEEKGPGLAWNAGVRRFNPFIPLILNEASTPFLILYRVQRGNALVGITFVVTFFLLRIVLNTSYFVPLLYNGCNRAIVFWPQAFPFFAIQWIFFYQILVAVLGSKKPSKKTA